MTLDRQGELKDLRGQQYREVNRADSVIISGTEYLRKSRLADMVEYAPHEELCATNAGRGEDCDCWKRGL